MRFLALSLVLASLAVPAVRAQEPVPQASPTPAPQEEPGIIAVPPLAAPIELGTPVPKPGGTPQWKDWAHSPHLTVSRNTGASFFVPRFWYRVQDQRVNVRTNNWNGDLRHNRFFVSAQYISVPGRTDVSASSMEARITPFRIGPVRPGLGYWTFTSKDANTVFASGGSSVLTSSNRTVSAGVFELAVGPFDKTHIRFTGLFGDARVTSGMDLYVDGQLRSSPLSTHDDQHSNFWGLGTEVAVRRWGFSLEGSVTAYRPRWKTIALPLDCAITSIGGSYMTPFKYAHVGAFARRTYISRVPDSEHSALQFINDGWTFGFSARVP